MYCAISGVTPKEPVLSKTGYVFERRLVEEHVQRLGTCPITKEPLTENDLTDIRVSRVVKPRTATATSVPALLQTFQNEWDALMVETFELRKQLDQVRTELAAALYRQDAAERTVARLIRERDQAREEATSGRQSTRAELEHAPSAVSGMEITGGRLSEAQEQVLDQVAATLIAARSERVVSPDTASPAHVRKLKESASVSVSKSVLCMAVDQGVAAVGSADGTVALLDFHGAATVVGGTKKAKAPSAVHAVGWVAGQGSNRMLLSGSADSCVKLWSVGAKGALSLSHDFTNVHTDAVASLAVHPCGRMFASAARDATWALVDLHTSATVYAVEGQEKYNAIRFHPDGLLLATAGEDAQHALRLWDIKTKEDVVALTAHTGAIASVSFSENGYFVATGAADSTVRVWDLRNLEQPLLLTEPVGGVVTSVAFDHSAQYLAVGGLTTLAVYSVHESSMDQLCRLQGHSSAVNDVAWAPNASALLSGARDGTVKVWKI